MTISQDTNGNDVFAREQALDHFMEEAYRRYAILTILDRAIPDARDGLKPVQRRILYAMGDMNLVHSSPHRKSARVVGEVLGKYHPHGDQSVYDAMVRMAQDFSMRAPLIDGQGNYGSIDGDSAAAMRYTEARLTSIGEGMLQDLEKDTVNWRPNFDGSLREPAVLPTRFPNLLVNGATGIAVGMSTSILPHNLGEVCAAVVFLAKNWKNKDQASILELMKIIPGPDLPTGGLLYRYRVNGDEKKVDMIQRAYETGNSTLVCQAKADIQDIGGGKSEILVTELPYQVQKATILERIASNRDKFPGLTDVRDESDYNGMRVVFEVARGTDPQDVLERLLTHTQMRSSLSYNSLALVQNAEGKASPKNMTLADMLNAFIKHRLEVITRRSRYELAKAEARLHILEGLLKALSMIDEVIDIIRHSQTTDTAKTNLMKKLSLSEIQAQAILDMPLRRLASLERKKLEDERKELLAKVKDLKAILSSEERRLEVVIEETTDIQSRYAEPRRTVIIEAEEGHQARITVADLVTPTEEQLILISTSGVQRVNAKGYKENVVKRKPSTRASDVYLRRAGISPDQSLMMVTNKGRLWQANPGRLPLQATFTELGLEKNERVIAAFAAAPGEKLVLVTSSGNVKRVAVEDCLAGRSEATWGAIIGLADAKDELLFAGLGPDEAQVILLTSGLDNAPSRALRFESGSVNPQATPSAKGVAAIKMQEDVLIGAQLLQPKTKVSSIVMVTTGGHAKRVSLDEFPVQGRAGQGVQAWKVSSATGLVCGFCLVGEKHAFDVASVKNKRLRLDAADLPLTARAVKGLDLNQKFGGGSIFGDDPVSTVVSLEEE